MLASILLLACTESAGDTASLPELPTSSCAGADHDWLPLEGMGQLVDTELMEEVSLDVDGVRSVMALAGAEDTSAARYDVEVHRFRYTTQDRGALTEATGLIALPVGATEATSLLFHHSTTGLEDFCAPSDRGLLWAAVPLSLASIGYAVVAPDYLGQNGMGEEAEALHPYLVAEPTAVASLDALRAMWAFVEAETELTASRRTLLAGLSQGGGAVFWSERYAADYLPEAELVGTLSVVPVLDVSTWAELAATELTVASIGVPLALEGMRDWYGVEGDLASIIGEEGVAELDAVVASECPTAEIPDEVDSLADIYTDPWLDAAAAGTLSEVEPWGCILEENSPATAPVGRTATVPTVLISGAADDIALPAQTTAAIDALCDDGHPVIALECEGLGHEDTVRATLDRMVALLAQLDAEQALAGEVCGTVTVETCGD